MPRRKDRSRSQGDLDEDIKALATGLAHARTSLGGELAFPMMDETPKPRVAARKMKAEAVRQQEGCVFARREVEGEGIYEGNWRGEKRNGRGKLLSKSGTVLYSGNWEGDKLHGYGVSQYDGGSRHEGLYQDGKRHGLGVFLWANGDKYSGNFMNGNIDGYGRFEWACGNVYVGNWRQGRMEGEGCMRKGDGHVLEGHFLQGELCGWARKKLPSGDCYEGYVSSNANEGYGEYTWLTGDFYEGQWLNNKIHGNGCLQLQSLCPSENHVYRGQFVHGRPRGFGEYSYVQDTKRCLGHWNAEGKGWARIVYHDTGLVYEGECRDGCREGKGELRYVLPTGLEPAHFEAEALRENGIEVILKTFGGRLVATFHNDVPEGLAILFFEDGSVEELYFQDGAAVDRPSQADASSEWTH